MSDDAQASLTATKSPQHPLQQWFALPPLPRASRGCAAAELTLAWAALGEAGLALLFTSAPAKINLRRWAGHLIQSVSLGAFLPTFKRTVVSGNCCQKLTQSDS